MFSTIRRKSGCSENFTPIISLDRHYNSSEKIHQTTSTTANIETMVPIRHPNNDILPRRTDTTSPILGYRFPAILEITQPFFRHCSV